MTASPVTVSSSPSGRVVTVVPVGDLDLATSEALRSGLAAAGRSSAGLVVLDLAQVDFLDSTAMGVVVGAHKQLAAAQKRLVLCHVGAVPARVLKITGLFELLDVRADAPPLAEDAVTG